MNKIITIDGPSGTGKGTLARALALKLGWHYLDSGMLYRVLAYALNSQGVNSDETEKICEIARRLPVEFSFNADRAVVLLNGQDVGALLMTEEIGGLASKIAANKAVREALLQRQHDFAVEPGLVTDGRDMGTVVFPGALLKIYLDASAEVRAERRFLQLQKRGENVSIDKITSELCERDQRDRERTVAPLKPAADAIIIDTSNMSAVALLSQVADKVDKLLGILGPDRGV